MFCPTCGKDNSLELKFCASCGTNLETVSQALTGREDDFFTKFDAGIDQFIARYTEHVFRNPVSAPSDQKVARSWRLLGEAVLTSLVDILLFTLMWNVLPLRFLILLISTPFRLLSERSKDNQLPEPSLEGYKVPELSEPGPQLWLSESVPSVTEHTTVNLGSTAGTKEKPIPITDQLK
jgi:hypothetical protein